MSTPNSPQSLWDFALAFYARPQVADACLQLQDEYQANVCLIIGMHWLDVRQQHLKEEEFAVLKNHIKAWTQEMVVPLRSLRRRLKLPFENLAQDDAQEQLRAAVKHAELLAEKKLLSAIEQWVMSLTALDTSDTFINLERYARELQAPQLLIEILQRE